MIKSRAFRIKKRAETFINKIKASSLYKLTLYETDRDG